MGKVDVGIDKNAIGKDVGEGLKKAFASAIEANKAIANDIQRRGLSLPGDTGQNFGNGIGYNNYLNTSFGFGGFYSGLPTEFVGVFPFQSINAFQHTQGSLSYFSRETHGAYYKMGMAVQAYKGFGVAKNVIDLMSNFASEGLAIKHKRPAIQKFYQRWAEAVNLQGVVKKILRYYYKYGNVFIYETKGVIDRKTYNKMKSTAKEDVVWSSNDDPVNDERNRDAERQSTKPLGRKQIPWRYTLLNPFQMDLRGTSFFGESEWVFRLDPETVAEAQAGRKTKNENSNSFEQLDVSEVNLPAEFKKIEADNGQHVVKLNKTRLWTLHYMKDDHEDWADPLLWPVMADIVYKNKLRQADISVCNSIISAVTIFKLGDFKNGWVAPGEHIRKFSEFLRSPTAAMSMVWNDAISIENSFPPVDRILSINKYESVDRDILRGLGIPDTLIGGASTSNFSTGFLGVKTLLERLEEGRNEVIRWINEQLKLVAKAMGHRDIPKIRFGKMSLRDEKAEKQLILGLLDRNIISIEAVLECFGEDFEIELERLKQEDKIRENDGVFIKHGPFTDPISDMTQSEVMDKEFRQQQKVNKQRSPQVRENGRPPMSGKPQEVQRETKPKGMGALLEYEKFKTRAFNLHAKVEELITANILKNKGKKYKKSLSKRDREGIENLSFLVASNIDVDTDVNMGVISKSLSSNKFIPVQIKANIDELSNELIAENKRQLTLDEKKAVFASAVALDRMENNA